MPDLMKTGGNAVAELKKREAELAAAREALKTSLLGDITNLTTQLAELGFIYSLIEQNGHAPKKLGRPRKETQNGKEDRG